jgi:hypothetical protein
MKKMSFTILFAIVFFISQAQVKEAFSNLKAEADKMGDAFVSGDYKTFVCYTYPLVTKSMGGAINMVEVLTNTTANMKAQGMTFSNITFNEPSKIQKSKNELQASITQHTEIKLPHGRIVTTSTLIAISVDDGVHWTFIDTSNKDMATLRKALPNLSPSIIIPPVQRPVHYNN